MDKECSYTTNTGLESSFKPQEVGVEKKQIPSQIDNLFLAIDILAKSIAHLSNKLETVVGKQPEDVRSDKVALCEMAPLAEEINRATLLIERISYDISMITDMVQL